MAKETISTTFSLNMSPSLDPMSPTGTHGDNYVDLISELPLDLVMSNILPRIFGQGLTVIDLDQPCRYLDVCNKWRERIALLEDNTITFAIGKHTMTERIYWRLSGVAPHIKTLQVGTFTDEFASTFTSQDIKFPLLTKLKIAYTCCQENIHLLLRDMPNLMYLDITDLHDEFEPFRLFELLDCCPRLAYFSKVSPRYGTDHITMATNVTKCYPNLVHLEWLVEMTLTSLMLSYFPNLTVLRLMGPLDSRDVDTLIKHCPKLQQLFIQESTDQSDITNLRIMKPNHRQGLRLLSLQGYTIDSNCILKLMMQHCDTLEMCILHDPWAMDELPIVDTMKHDIELKRLESLEYSTCFAPECFQTIRWIIQHAPNLNSVKTTGGAEIRRVLSTLIHRPIRSIQLACPSSHKQNEYDFIAHHVKLGMGSSLQELICIIDQPSSDDHWIHLIPGLAQLKSLELLFRHDLPFEYYIDIDELFELILELAHGCSSLEKLTLHFWRSYPVPPLEWILPLSDHPHLKHLVIEADSGPKDMFAYLTRFQHLDKVHVKLATCDINYMADMARRIPNLVYTVKENK